MSGHAIRIVSMLATGALVVLGWPGVAPAEATNDTGAVQCVLQSASLNFGRLNPQRSPLVAGEGEALVACQNTVPEVRRIALALTFPTLGAHTAAVRSGHGALAVALYHDAQFAQRWGDDRNGAAALHILLALGPGERKQLRLPVYALLHSPRSAAAGVYLTHIPLTLTTLPR